jgi:hypothetical protein
MQKSVRFFRSTRRVVVLGVSLAKWLVAARRMFFRRFWRGRGVVVAVPLAVSPLRESLIDASRARANQIAATKRQRQKAKGQPSEEARTFAALNGLLDSTFVRAKAPVIARNHVCQGGAQTAGWRASNTLTYMTKFSRRGARGDWRGCWLM